MTPHDLPLPCFKRASPVCRKKLFPIQDLQNSLLKNSSFHCPIIHSYYFGTFPFESNCLEGLRTIVRLESTVLQTTTGDQGYLRQRGPWDLDSEDRTLRLRTFRRHTPRPLSFTDAIPGTRGPRMSDRLNLYKKTPSSVVVLIYIRLRCCL